MAMGTLAIKRPNDLGGYFRRLKIYVDGAEVAGLRPNKTFTIEVIAGVHEVRGRMDWRSCVPLRVQVTDGEIAPVEVSLPYSSAIKSFTDPKHAVQARVV
jgi:hypothetical protein